MAIWYIFPRFEKSGNPGHKLMGGVDSENLIQVTSWDLRREAAEPTTDRTFVRAGSWGSTRRWSGEARVDLMNQFRP
jgi:hypothetical protein